MVEILEYSLVFLASSMLAGFSIVALSSYAGYLRHAEDQGAFSALSGAAADAAENGNSSLTLSLADASLSCSEGVFSLSSPSFSASVMLPVACDFEYAGLDGSYGFNFTVESGTLSLAVS